MLSRRQDQGSPADCMSMATGVRLHLEKGPPQMFVDFRIGVHKHVQVDIQKKDKKRRLGI